MRLRPASPRQIALGDAYPGRVVLTDEFAAHAEPDNRYVRDSLVNRLLFRAGPRKRVWLLRHGKSGRLKLGEWPAMTAHQARERALNMVHGRA